MLKHFLLLLCALPAILCAQIQQYSDMPVGGIDVILCGPESDKDFDARGIRSAMKTKVGDNFSQLDFDDDLKHLAEDYDRVEPSLSVQGDRVYITMRLWPRPIIDAINFHGNYTIRSSKLLRELDIKTDTIFDRKAFNTQFHKLKMFYVQKGYFESDLNYTICPVEGKNAITIEVQVDEGRAGRVTNIGFVGFTRQERADILEMIHTKRYFLFTSWITRSGTYHEEAVEQDRYQVLSYLHNQGYADADVKIDVIEDPRGRGIRLKIIADKGELYDFGAITFCGNTLFSNETVESVLLVKEGAPYSPEKLRETVQALTDLYGEKGYIEAVVNYEPHLDPSKRRYDVEFSIQEGAQYRVGLVRVFGNRSTEHGVILHETQLCPGDVFDIRKLQATEAILGNMGYFENVNVYAVRSPADTESGPYYRDIHIEVEETGTGTFGVFGGFSSLESVFGGIELVERNFNYKGLWRLRDRGMRALRGGGEFLKLRLNLGQKQYSFTASWTKPYFNNTPWIVGLDFERSVSKLQSNKYVIRTTGLSARADYPINCFLRFGTYYRFRYEDVHLEDRRTAPPALRRQAENQGTVAALGSALTYDSVNFCHTDGFRSILKAEAAFWPGKFKFFSLAYLNTLYQPLIANCVLKLRYDARFIQPLLRQNRAGIPLGERIFLGGESTVRGYRPWSLGSEFGDKEPTGGFSSMLFSGEIMRPIIPKVEVFGFLDGGYVHRHLWAWATPRWSLGGGVRLEVMNGVPLILGLGYPLNVPAGRHDDVQHFFFSMGGRF